MSDTSTADVRRDHLQHWIDAEGYLSIAVAAAELGVTEMTIRRDLQSLVERGLVRRVHGGASRPTVLGTPPDDHPDARAEAKERIARCAVDYIEPYHVIALDSGTTVARLSAVLIQALDEDGGLGGTGRLVAISHSVPALATLSTEPRISLIGLGGLFQADTNSFCGPATRQAIAELNIDVLFVAATGLTAEGLHCGTPHDAETKRALIDRASRVIALVDAAKLGRRAAVRMAPPEAVDLVITDSSIAESQARLLHEIGLAYVSA